MREVLFALILLAWHGTSVASQPLGLFEPVLYGHGKPFYLDNLDGVPVAVADCERAQP